MKNTLCRKRKENLIIILGLANRYLLSGGRNEVGSYIEKIVAFICKISRKIT